MARSAAPQSDVASPAASSLRAPKRGASRALAWPAAMMPTALAAKMRLNIWAEVP